jgi:glycosyltransferase 2 family protein
MVRGERVNESTSESQSTHRTARQSSRRSKRHGRPAWIGGALALGVAAFVALLALTGVGELWRVLVEAEHALLVLPLLCVAASYLTMALSYHGIARAAGDHIQFLDMLKITLVANSLNYLVATGGLSGFAARTYYFTRRSVPPENAVVISLAQTFLTNVTLLAFVLLGFSYVFVSRELEGAALAGTAATTGVFLLLALASGAVLLHRTLRRRFLLVVAELTHRTFARLRPAAGLSRISLRRYLATLDRGIAFLLANRRAMIGPLVFIVLDWIFTILILHTAFLAIGEALPFGQTVVGFSVGLILSFVSLIPGGLGVMEGSMSAIFAGMGVPLESAVAAALLFRFFYYIFPLLVSLVFLRDILSQLRSAR